MFLDTSFIIFGLFIILLLLTGLYVWRRISSLESYNKILEKKVNHMKKENKELKELLYGSGEDDINDADVIMNKIFNADMCSVASTAAAGCCDTSQYEKPTTKVTCNDDKCMIVEDTSDIVQNIIAESTETKPVFHTSSFHTSSFHTFPKPVMQSVETAAIPVMQVTPNVEVSVAPPVVEHVTQVAQAAQVAQIDDNDLESVISDAVSGVTAAPYNRKKLSKMNLDKLKDICTSMQLSVEGTKNVLIDRILSNLTLE